MVWPTLAEVYMIKTDQSKNQDIFPFQRLLALSVVQVSKTLSRKPTELVSPESRFWSSQFSGCFRTYPLIDTGNNFVITPWFSICEAWIRTLHIYTYVILYVYKIHGTCSPGIHAYHRHKYMCDTPWVVCIQLPNILLVLLFLQICMFIDIVF